MSQFRTTADILDEILQEAGEVTNGNSPYETIALTVANHVHHAIIAGGSIFDVEVDEPWVWARAKHPITLELQSAFEDGTISATASGTNITFTTASSVSLEGWHLQAKGKSTVYKITNHTANGTTAQLDSVFIDDSGSYNFRAFKLDYEIAPSYLYIDNNNDRFDFGETAATTLAATLTHGTYTPANLLTHVFQQMTAAGATATYGGSYNTVYKTFNLTASVAFKMFGLSGLNYRRSVLPVLGFDKIDHTGAQSYTSTYTPNPVSRLMEPFKLFVSAEKPFIYSTDPIKMQQDYPISEITQKVPDRFCRINEDPDGAITVRFNGYPKDKTKVMIDWIAQPQDLKDNVASRILLPRGDVRTFIYAAASYIAFMKHSDKFQALIGLTKAGLMAMQKKNRALLFRTGETFAQQTPREDLSSKQPKLDYGYTSGSN